MPRTPANRKASGSSGRAAPRSTRDGGAALAPAAVALLLFLITRWFILFDFTPIASDIDVRYYPYVERAIDIGDLPYAGTFQIEYPPVAWWVIAGIRHLSGPAVPASASSGAHAASRDSYTSTFRSVMGVLDLASFFLFGAIVRQRRPRALGLLLMTYTIATALLAHVLYDRLDLGVLVLLLAWAYGWTHASREDAEPSLAWTAAAYGAIGLGVAYKIIPILALPFLLRAEWRGAGRVRRLTVAAAMLLATIVLPVVAQYHASGPGTLNFLTYQSERGIEIESLFATIMAIVSLFGPSIAVSLSHGGSDLVGTLAPVMKTTSSVALVALLGGLIFWTDARFSTFTRTSAYQRACFAIAGAVILSPVLSPQYFVWALPIVLLLAADLAPGRALTIVAALVVVLSALTTWVFPYHFYYWGQATPHGLVPINMDLALPPSALPFVVVGLRNVVYLAVVVWLGAKLVAERAGSGLGA